MYIFNVFLWQGLDAKAIRFMFDGVPIKEDDSPDQVCISFLKNNFSIYLYIYSLSSLFLYLSLLFFNFIIQLGMEENDSIDAMAGQTGGFQVSFSHHLFCWMCDCICDWILKFTWMLNGTRAIRGYRFYYFQFYLYVLTKKIFCTLILICQYVALILLTLYWKH